jgi:hypothetical protein
MYLNNMLCRQEVGIAAIKNFINNNQDNINVIFEDNIIKIYKYINILDDTFIKCLTVQCTVKQYDILYDMLIHY